MELNKKYRVLFLEDEPAIRGVLAEYMRQAGYEVREAADGLKAQSCLEKEIFDIAVLDIMVPGIDGFAILSGLREKAPYTAVIMLTALDDEKTQIHAFDLLADDYVIKPISPVLLLKRMETILRRMEINPEKASAFTNQGVRQGLVLQEESYRAFYEGRQLPLTLSEFLLLQTLYQEPGRAFTREQLILRIYNEDYLGSDRIIDAHVKNLRKKLPFSCIRTVVGVGYQFDEQGVQSVSDRRRS